MTSKSDKALFRSAVENIVPIDKDCTHRSLDAKKQAIFKAYSYMSDAKLSGSDIIAHAQSGVSTKIIKKMKQGNIDFAPVLDLHGQTIVEACVSLSQFMYYHQNEQFIHIIHGKGYHSEHGLSILKTQVISYLKQHPSVLAFNTCPDKDGGTGAVFVLMRNHV